jgi:two-component system NtrC family response regulator
MSQSRPAEVAVDSGRKPSLPWAPGELRALVVDDEADVLLGLRMLMESLGVDVRTASGGAAALNLIGSWVPHLVLSDITMDRMTGLELLDRLQRQHPAIKVVLITGYGTIELAVSSLHRGAVHFITKPFDNEEILSAVRQFGQEALLDEQMRRMAKEAPAEGEPTIIAQDSRMQAVLDLIDEVAVTSMTVLIRGETGTGKELIAQAVHFRSPRGDRPFLPVNTAALPDTLLESELFGHKKGAFTGADGDRRGVFQQVAGGTVFLDEIGLMSTAFQAKLLRVLQEKTVVPLGTTQTHPVDFRLIAATSCNLHERIEQGTFREDLYYRLRVVTVDLPPLRERPDDIAALATHFLAKYAPQVQPVPSQSEGPIHSAPPRLSAGVVEELMRHPWPGNVRELENCMQRALVLSRGHEIRAFHLGLTDEEAAWPPIMDSSLSYEEAKHRAVEHFQRLHIERALARSEGNITRAAEAVGLTRAAFQRIVRSLNVDRSSFVQD